MNKTGQDGPSAAMVLLLAVSCGVIVANIYIAQPLVGIIGPAVGLSAGAAGLIVSITQLGYAAGLLLLVPLGDLAENRRLVVVTVAAAVPALLWASIARHGAEMLAAAGLIGLTSVSVQMLVPLAAHLAPDATRGRIVGNVMSGLLFGILLSRPAASLITASFGWRAVFWTEAAIMGAMALTLRCTLPVRRPAIKQTYFALLGSIVALPFKVRLLRARAVYQSASFAAFSLFWTGAPLLLSRNFHYGQRGIALFALAGAAGALAAPIAGRLADREFGRKGTVFALLLVAAAFLVAWWGAEIRSVILLAAAGVLLDAGVQANLVFSQRVLFALAPEQRSRLNGVFMASFFLGGAAGSAATGPLLAHGGWPALCVAAGALPLLALIYFIVADKG